MFILWQQNHTNGRAEFGPAASSVDALKEHMAQGEVTWKDGTAYEFSDTPPEEWKGWDWFVGASRGGQTTHTAYIRPLEVLGDTVLRHEERTAVWTKGKKAPVLKFDNFDFDILTVRLEGDTTEAFRFTVKEVRRFAREHQAPHHFTLKVAPNLNSLFRLETT